MDWKNSLFRSFPVDQLLNTFFIAGLFYFMNQQIKSKGQIEDKLTKKAISFYKEIFGIGPKQARVYIIEDMIIVRLQTELLPMEKKLLTKKSGVKIVKNLRENLHDTTIEEISKIIKEVTNQTVISAHSDVSTKTGEIIEIFILDKDFQKQLA